MKYIQGDTHRFARRDRHIGGKHVLVNDTTTACITRSSYGRKRYFPLFPPKRRSVESRRQSNGNSGSWNVVRLYEIIHVGIIKVSPTTTLNIHRAPGALCANAIPGE